MRDCLIPAGNFDEKIFLVKKAHLEIGTSDTALILMHTCMELRNNPGAPLTYFSDGEV